MLPLQPPRAVPLSPRGASRPLAASPNSLAAAPVTATDGGPSADSTDAHEGDTVDQRLLFALEEVLARDEAAVANEALAKQQAAFDQLLAVRSEQQREYNALRDLMMAQAKQDDEALKKWIALI